MSSGSVLVFWGYRSLDSVALVMSWETATGPDGQPWTVQQLNPSQCPISPVLTLLFLLDVGMEQWVEMETGLFISPAGEGSQMPVHL